MLTNLTSAWSPIDRPLGAGLRFVLLIGLCFLVTSTGSEAEAKKKKRRGPYHPMYTYKIAATGQCIQRKSSDYRSVLRRNGIGWKGDPSQRELAALAKGIGQVENLLGRPLPSSWRTKYNYITISWKKRSTWNQGASAINVRRQKGTAKGENVERLMHELGHKVGNTGQYQKYLRYTGGKWCPITDYAMKDSHEQFAEVFGAYVTYPDLLKSKCPRAYGFFANKLFPNSQSKVATCSRGGGNGNGGSANGGFR